MLEKIRKVHTYQVCQRTKLSSKQTGTSFYEHRGRSGKVLEIRAGHRNEPPDSLVINRLHANLINIKLTHTSYQNRAYLPIVTWRDSRPGAIAFEPSERRWIPLCLLNAIIGRKKVWMLLLLARKAMRKSKFSVLVRYAAQKLIDTTPKTKKAI